MTTMSEYYINELAEWSHDVNLHLDEMDQLEDKLTAVIRRNSIPGIAGEVEKHLHHLEKITDILKTLQYDIREQETLLNSNAARSAKEDVLKDIEKKQSVLRLNMHAAEKEFIDVKFGCYDFLSGTLKK